MRAFLESVLNIPLTTYLSIVSTGAALALLAAYLHCRFRGNQCARVRGQGLIDRIVTFLWTVGGGMATSLAAHWLVRSGRADEVIDWLSSALKFVV